jgi:hypothetical protein
MNPAIGEAAEQQTSPPRTTVEADGQTPLAQLLEGRIFDCEWNCFESKEPFGTPERIRTSDLLLRRQTLYPD